MATSSILGGERLPRHVKGKDTNALGPSDNSDSGSDAQGAYGTDELSSDSDAEGTGERASIGLGLERRSGRGGDIMPDHIEGAGDESDSDSALDEDEEDFADVESLAADDSDALDDEDEDDSR